MSSRGHGHSTASQGLMCHGQQQPEPLRTRLAPAPKAWQDRWEGIRRPQPGKHSQVLGKRDDSYEDRDLDRWARREAPQLRGAGRGQASVTTQQGQPYSRSPGLHESKLLRHFPPAK